MADKLIVSGARGASFAEVARRVGSIAGVAVSPTATDAEVLDLIAGGLAEVVTAAGYSVIDPVRAATTSNLDLSGDETIDGVNLDTGDRVLVKDQTVSAQNGIYVVDTAGAWVRAADFDATSEVIQGSYVVVEDGDQAGAYVLTTSDPITVGTTDLTWRLFRSDDLAKLAKADGADRIGHQAPGSTKVVTAAAIIRETVHLDRYGVADSDGTGSSGTDNTAAIGLALSALGTRGGRLKAGHGIYRHQGINLPTNVVIEGIGSDSSVLYCPETGPNVTSGDGVAEIRNARLAHLKLLGTTTSGFAFRGRRFGNQCVLDDVYTDYGLGIDLEYCYTALIENSRIFRSQAKGLRIGTTSHNFTVRKTMINACLHDGIEVVGSYDVVIEENDLEFNQRNQILITDGRGVIVRKNYLEGLAPRSSGYAGVYVLDADTVIIEDNKMDATQTGFLGTDGTGTYLKAVGGTRIKHRNNAFVSISSSQTHVDFGAGASNCTALVPLGATYTNASPTSRIHNDEGDEIGVLAVNEVAQTLTDGAWTKVQFPSESFDPKGEWSTSAHRFTPRDYGVYAINAIVGVDALSTNGFFFLRLWNATASQEVAKVQCFPNNFAGSAPIAQLVLNDFLQPGSNYEIQCFLDDSANRDTPATASTQRLTIKRIG